MQAIELDMPIGQDGNIHLPEQYHRLYGQQARFVILLPDDSEQAATDVNPADERRGEHWPLLEPARDLARFVGTSPFPEDGVTYQRRIRDSEWS